MIVLRNIVAATALGLGLAGCKLAIINPEGGTVYSLSGTRDCTPGKVCTFDVDSTTFSETFTAVPAPGYDFVNWVPGERFICDDSTSPDCTLTLVDDALAQAVVDNPETFYAMPKFELNGSPVSPLTVPVASSHDDAEESGTAVSLTGAVLNLDPGDSVGLRFPGIPLPQGALIISAHIEMVQAGSDDVGNTGLTFRVEDAASAAPYVAADGAIDDRVYGPQEYWPVTQTWYEGNTYPSVDLTDLVQYVISRGDWESGNAIAFRITNDGAYDRTVRAFDGAPANAPRLVLEFAY
jgi:hypothetical protein